MRILLNTIMALGIAFANPLWAQTEGKIHNFRMTLCSANGQKCLNVEGFEARQSILAPIFSFKNSRVRWVDRSNGSSKVFLNARGHIDFGSAQVVLLEKKPNLVVERTFPLETLEEIEYVVK